MSRKYRRRFLVVLVASLMTPRLASSQRQRDLPKLGALWAADASTAVPYLAAFKERLRELGWVDGRTIQIIIRYDDGVAARRSEIAAEVVALGVDVMFVWDPILSAARKATKAIPMVSGDMYDPISEGITTSMARPDGNVTGVSWQTLDTAGKRVQLVQELKPRAKRIGFMTEAGDVGAAIELRGVLIAARHIRTTIVKMELRTAHDLEPTLTKLRGARLDALIVGATTQTWPVIHRIVEAATSNGIPIISEPEEFARAGAVITYGVDVFAALRRSAFFIDRILKGAAPKDLPIEQPTKFDLVVNLRAAKTLGLAIPASIMESATKVIR